MAIYKEPFWVKLETEYAHNELTTEEDWEELKSKIEQDDRSIVNEYGEKKEGEDVMHARFGGKFDWQLAKNNPTDSENPLIKVQLMRLWCVQMVQQMTTGKSYLNEADSSVKVSDITEEESKVTLEVMQKLISSVHEEISEINNRLVPRNRLKKPSEVWYSRC